MSKSRILVIEDDPAIRRGIVDALHFEGYDTFEAADGLTGLDRAVGVDCDLILLDLVLPRGDGLDILREVRVTRPTLPVIVLTGGEEADRVEGLRRGADDYVVKPFSVRELLARVEAVLRRSPERPGDVGVVKVLGGVVDLAGRSALRGWRAAGIVRTRGRVARLPGGERRAGDFAGRDSLAGVAAGPKGDRIADDRHARGPAGEKSATIRLARGWC